MATREEFRGNIGAVIPLLLRKDRKSWRDFWKAIDPFIRMTIKKLLYNKRICMSREEIEDIVQDVFYTMVKLDCKFLRNYDASKNVEFTTYVYPLIHHRVVDYFRKQMRIPCTYCGDLDQICLSEETHAIENILALLHGKERQVLELCYVDDLNVSEVARVLGCSSNAVCINKHRAMKKIKSKFVHERMEMYGANNS